MKRTTPVIIREPDSQSRAVADRLHLAIIRGSQQGKLQIVLISCQIFSGMSELNNSATTSPRSPCTSFKLPTKLRNSLASMGLVCSENSEYIGPLGNFQGTGLGKVYIYYFIAFLS